MAELYTGIAGSPITYLAGDISAEQTTIAVADDSALPDAPNICTIGYGEHIETIKYEAKSNGVLQNVTRGIEGTPRAWPSGTEVARFFTAHDHNAIIAELEDARLSDVKEKTFDDLKGRLEEIEQDHDTHLADMTPQIISSSFTRVVGDSGTIYARYIPFLNLVWLSFNITGISEDTSSSTTIITFDTKYAPVTTIRGVVRSPSASGGTGQISIGSGSINVTMDSNQNTLRGVYTWFTA